MGHFSKFVRPDSVRLGISVLSGSVPSSIKALAFRTEDNMNVIVVQNTGFSLHLFLFYDFVLNSIISREKGGGF